MNVVPMSCLCDIVLSLLSSGLGSDLLITSLSAVKLIIYIPHRIIIF